MSGIAIIIEDADYSQSGLGQVTLKGDVPSGQVTDGLTHDYDAFEANSVTIADKKSQSSIAFNGSVGNNYIDLTSKSQDSASQSSQSTLGAIVDGLYEFTIEIVAGISGWANPNYLPIYADYGTEADGRIQMFIGAISGHDNAAFVIRKSRAWVWSSGMSGVNTSIDPSVPHIFHVVRAADQSGTTFKFYVDGVLKGTEEFAIRYATSAKKSDILHANIARRFYALRSYNRELTPQEIQANYNYNVARYSFNQ